MSGQNLDLQLLRRREVERLTGLKTSTLYKLIKEGRFPKQVQISPQCVAWRRRDIAAWVDGLLPATDGLEGVTK